MTSQKRQQQLDIVSTSVIDIDIQQVNYFGPLKISKRETEFPELRKVQTTSIKKTATTIQQYAALQHIKEKRK